MDRHYSGKRSRARNKNSGVVQKKRRPIDNPDVHYESFPFKEELLEGFKLLLQDVSLTHPIESEDFRFLIKNYEKLVNNMFSLLESCTGDDWMVNFQKKVKDQCSLLTSMEGILLGIKPGQEIDMFTLMGKHNLKEKDIKDLWYLPKDWFLIIQDLESDDGDTIHFKGLYNFVKSACLIMLTSYWVIGLKSDAFKMISSYILSTLKTHQLINQSNKQKREYLLNQIKEIETPIEFDLYLDEEFMNIWHEFEELVREGKDPIISDLSAAIRRQKAYIESPFDPQKDVYLSPHASASESEDFRIPFRSHGKNLSRKLPSYLASVFECDHWKEEPVVQILDEEIKFNSPYRTEELSGCKTYSEVIIVIDNPAKYKPRIIHITNNPLMDRCNWGRNRLKSVNQQLKTDCIDDQSEMFRFSQIITKQLSVMKTRWGVYGWDFESATDFGNIDFEGLCLGLVFPKSFIDFWRWMSKLPQVALLPKESGHGFDLLDVKQEKGQPQGVILSMDSFSFTHGIVNRLTMFLARKKAGLEILQNSVEIKTALGITAKTAKVRPSHFFETVGDDNQQCTLIEDPLVSEDYWDYENNTWSDKDPGPGRRTVIEMIHRQVCQWANYKINDQKSMFNEWCPAYENGSREPNYQIEAIHLTVMNSEVVSPIPPRLINGYCNFKTAIASLLWASQHDYSISFIRTLLNQVLLRYFEHIKGSKEYSEKEAKLLLISLNFLIYGGITRQFKDFTIPGYCENLSPKVFATVKLIYSQVSLRHSIIYAYQNDAYTSTAKFLNESFSNLQEEVNFLKNCVGSVTNSDRFQELWDNLPMDHKAFFLYEDEQDTIDCLSSLFDSDDDNFLSSLAIFFSHNKERDKFRLALEESAFLSMIGTFEPISDDSDEILYDFKDPQAVNLIINRKLDAIHEANGLLHGRSVRRSHLHDSCILTNTCKEIMKDQSSLRPLKDIDEFDIQKLPCFISETGVEDHYQD